MKTNLQREKPNNKKRVTTTKHSPKDCIDCAVWYANGVPTEQPLQDDTPTDEEIDEERDKIHMATCSDCEPLKEKEFIKTHKRNTDLLKSYQEDYGRPEVKECDCPHHKIGLTSNIHTEECLSNPNCYNVMPQQTSRECSCVPFATADEIRCRVHSQQDSSWEEEFDKEFMAGTFVVFTAQKKADIKSFISKALSQQKARLREKIAKKIINNSKFTSDNYQVIHANIVLNILNELEGDEKC